MAFVPVMMAAAAGVSAVSSIAEGNAAKAAGEYNARINETNAQIAESRTNADIESMRRAQRRMLGTLRASVGANGITMDGSASDVFSDSLAESELDILSRRYSGELEAMGFNQTAELDRLNARTAARSGRMGAVGTLLGAGANLYGKPGTSVRVNSSDVRTSIW